MFKCYTKRCCCFSIQARLQRDFINKEENILEIVSINEPILENIALEVWTGFIATLYEKATEYCIEK